MRVRCAIYHGREEVVGGCIRDPRTKTSYASWFFGKLAVQSSYSGNTLRSPIEAPLISREVLPETYFLLVIMAADAQAGPFLQVSSIVLMWNLVKF